MITEAIENVKYSGGSSEEEGEDPPIQRIS
jgi:hypothetical protein